MMYTETVCNVTFHTLSSWYTLNSFPFVFLLSIHIFSSWDTPTKGKRPHPRIQIFLQVFFPKKASYCLRNFSTEEEAKYSISRFYLKWVHSYFQMYNWFSQVKKKSFKELKRTTTQYWLVSHKIASLPRKLSCKFSCARPAIKAERFRVN